MVLWIVLLPSASSHIFVHSVLILQLFANGSDKWGRGDIFYYQMTSRLWEPVIQRRGLEKMNSARMTSLRGTILKLKGSVYSHHQIYHQVDLAFTRFQSTSFFSYFAQVSIALDIRSSDWKIFTAKFSAVQAFYKRIGGKIRKLGESAKGCRALISSCKCLAYHAYDRKNDKARVI